MPPCGRTTDTQRRAGLRASRSSCLRPPLNAFCSTLSTRSRRCRNRLSSCVELRAQFGNLGLAAAAYNAGPQRVQDWLAKKRTLPSETRAYVRTVTGRPADEWTRPEANVWAVTVPGDTPCVEAAKLAAKHAPTTTIVQQHRSIAAWAVQLVGDRSEINALASYNRLRKKHEAILGAYQPVVVRTTMGVSTAAIWHGSASKQTVVTLLKRYAQDYVRPVETAWSSVSDVCSFRMPQSKEEAGVILGVGCDASGGRSRYGFPQRGVGVVRTRLSPAPARMVNSGINLVPVTAHHDPSRASRPRRLSAPNAEPRWGSAFSFLV